MTEVESRVFNAVKRHPMASQQQLADLLGMSRESIAGHIMRLTRQGLILGKGYIVPSQNGIVIVGGSNLDIHGKSRSPLCLEDSNPGDVIQSPGGVGRNIAENLAHLGEPTTLLSMVGMDPSGDWVIEQTQLSGVNTENIIQHPEYPTSTYLAVNDDQGQLVAAIADMRIIDALDSSLLNTKTSLFHSAQCLIIEANLTSSVIEWFSHQPFQTFWVADAVSASKAPRLRPILSRLNLLKVNQDEARAILDSSAQQPTALASELLDTGVSAVLLSLGDQGMLYQDKTQSLEIPCYQTTPISDTGAGDALLAGFIHARNKEWPLKEQLNFSLACAGITLECQHANHPNLNDPTIHTWMKTR
ncbi:PfkB family carbohydrate kinase [Marinomonas pollencensis]|uniref:Pseudouridine kinase n=1 Tax=Marinomonas pollencensis TaxID=491954 RepID=A0A3E0DIA3_9GAMM|nr:PfkB family carbohydrate kinase [Marinomonas pollencensis]REG82409.1 pseudouridine kinase [Marinomonas pollencensis]